MASTLSHAEETGGDGKPLFDACRGVSKEMFLRALALERSPVAGIPDLPPSLHGRHDTLGNNFVPVDLRGEFVGVLEAQEYLDKGRTQIWRDARDGKLPSVNMGTKNRPVYRFRPQDLREYKRRCDEMKAREEDERRLRAAEKDRRKGRSRRRARTSQELLRLTVEMMASGQIDIDKVIEMQNRGPRGERIKLLPSSPPG